MFHENCYKRDAISKPRINSKGGSSQIKKEEHQVRIKKKITVNGSATLNVINLPHSRANFLDLSTNA